MDNLFEKDDRGLAELMNFGICRSSGAQIDLPLV